MEKLPKGAFPFIIAAVIGLIIMAKSVKTIDSGHAGVLYQLGGGVDPDSEPLGEGINFVAPGTVSAEF